MGTTTETIRGRTLDEVRQYDLFKMVVAALLLINWLYFGVGKREAEPAALAQSTETAQLNAPAKPVARAQPVAPSPAAASAAAPAAAPATSTPATASASAAAPGQAATAAQSGAAAPAPTAAAQSTAPASVAAPAQAAPSPAKVYFAFGQAELPAEADALLRELVGYAKADTGVKLDLSGFHDKHGDPEFNADLAKRRAQSVRDYLVRQGIAIDRIVLVKPQLTTGGGDDRQARRVEVSVAR